MPLCLDASVWEQDWLIGHERHARLIDKTCPRLDFAGDTDSSLDFAANTEPPQSP